MTRQNNQSTAVATIHPPRMEMPPAVAQEYNLTPDSWRALTDAIFPTAKTVGAVVLALAYCKRHRLDIFQRVVHIVPMKIGGRDAESVWPGIGQLRVLAQRQPDWAGFDDCEFGPDIEREFEGMRTKWKERPNGGWQPDGSEKVVKKITFPEWARFVVYKTINGERVRLPGPKVYWLETYATMGRDNPCPNEMWEKRPRGQLEKCAEAAAWRRAFPDVLGNEYAMEEMMGKDMAAPIEGTYVEVKEDSPHTREAPQQRPRQEQRQEPQQQAGGPVEHNPLDTDEIPPANAWPDYLRLVRERLETFEYPSQVAEFRAAEKFRIDCAPPDIQVRADALFNVRDAELIGDGDDTANGAMGAEEPADDNAGDEEGGHDEEAAG